MVDPFSRFAQRKAQDNSEIAELQKAEADRLHTQFTTYANNHRKILDCLKQFNPEPVVLQLFDVGFKDNLKYPDAAIKRYVCSAVFSDDRKLVYC